MAASSASRSSDRRAMKRESLALSALLAVALVGLAAAASAPPSSSSRSSSATTTSKSSPPRGQVTTASVLLSPESESKHLTLDIPGMVSNGLMSTGRALAAKRFSFGKRSTSPSKSSPSTSSLCSARATVTPAWTTLAGNPAVSLDVEITNQGQAPISTPWEVKLEGPAYSSALQSWNLEKARVDGSSSPTTFSGQAPGYWQAIPPSGGKASFGIILELSKEGIAASSSDAAALASSAATEKTLLHGAPSALTLNGYPCELSTSVQEPSELALTLPVPPSSSEEGNNGTTTTIAPLPTDATPTPTSTPTTITPTPPPAPPSANSSSSDPGATIFPGRMTTINGKIIGVDGRPLYLMGLNWFGFDCGATMVDGLWGGRDATAQDFANVVYRIKLLGFNAVRLPFSFKDLYEKSPKWLNTKCTSVPPDAVAALTRPSSVSASAAGTPPPPGDAFAVSSPPGTCNSYMPQQSTLDRFLWTVDYFARNGIYVMLDNQFNLDQTATQQPSLWVQRWTDLATKLTQRYPFAASMSLIDILNEPDAWGVGWTPANGKPGYGDMALAIMDSLYKVNPGFLYVLEGCGQAALAKNWGDGMAVDPFLVNGRFGAWSKLSDPNPFFRTLLTKPYLSQVVAGPHVYSPSVSSAQDSTEGPALYKRLSQSFGYLNKQGYCDGNNTVGSPSGNCHVFPVVIGETGTGFIDPRDLQPQLDLAAWAVAQPGSGSPADDGLHNPVQGFFWWAWNANGDGQMGLVQNDWTTVDWNKVRYLESVGLKPWYKNNGTQPPSPTPTPSPPPPTPTTTTPPPTPPPTATPPVPTTTPPTPPPTATPPSTPPTPPPTATPSTTEPSTPPPTTTPPQTWPVAPMIPPITPPGTGRRRPGEGQEEEGNVGDALVVGEETETSPTPPEAPTTTPSSNDAVGAAEDEATAGPPSSSPAPPPPISLDAMVGEVFAWAASDDASPPIQVAGSTGELSSASAESDDGGGGVGLKRTRPLSTFGGLLLGSDGAPFDLMAVSWGGFDSAENGGWLEGLAPPSSNSSSSSDSSPPPTTAEADVRTQFSRMRALGFTAVKFPFTMPVVLGEEEASPSSAVVVERECALTPEEEVKAATAPAPTTAWNHWPLGAPLPRNGTCNAGAPSSSSSPSVPPALARLRWAAAAAVESGLYVVLEDAGTTAAEDPALWVEGWSRVASTVANEPISADPSGNDKKVLETRSKVAVVGDRLALRLLRDPDALALSWATPSPPPPPKKNKNNSTTSSPSRPRPASLRRLSLAALDTLSRVAPSALLLVPGGGQYALFGGVDETKVELTGAGFASDAAALSASGIDPLASADGFLTELVGTRQSYLDRVVLSPTLGVSNGDVVGGAATSTDEVELPTSQRLWRALDASFGYLASAGFCLGGGGVGAKASSPASSSSSPPSSCHRFAVAVGGLGGPAWTSGSGAARLRADVAAWLQPTCGLPLCSSAAAGASAGASGRDTSRPAVRSWSWDSWSVSRGGETAESTNYSVLVAPDSSAKAAASAAGVPLIDWQVVDWLRSIGMSPWTDAPSTAWREGPGPAPTDVLQAAGNEKASASAEGEQAPECAAVYSVDARGGEKSGAGSSATARPVASVVLTLANLGRAAIAPPFTVSMATAAASSPSSSSSSDLFYEAVLQAHGVAAGSAHVTTAAASSSSPSAAARSQVRARVTDPWSVLWPSAGSSVSLSLVVRGGAVGGNESKNKHSNATAVALSLAPAEVSINGMRCSVARAELSGTVSAEGEGFGGVAPSVMQTSRGFPGAAAV